MFARARTVGIVKDGKEKRSISDRQIDIFTLHFIQAYIVKLKFTYVTHYVIALIIQ